ncbi:acylphosphatase [Pelagibius sp. Alg239-R121]|uniref:acylphosphatase n=1 Tax=Pelagibius sp. Alg239-R121 TaxID=2993448 RepID=UPI0024A730CF|nr:acylphosphatase [Pelagibius sp. Alg239-R121]
MTPAVKTLRAVISGRVQGVWFRGWTERQARARGLDGWVRNCSDGTVEAVFSGAADQVDEMIEDCWKGPPAAKVASIQLYREEPSVESGFIHLRR